MSAGQINETPPPPMQRRAEILAAWRCAIWRDVHAVAAWWRMHRHKVLSLVAGFLIGIVITTCSSTQLGHAMATAAVRG